MDYQNINFFIGWLVGNQIRLQINQNEVIEEPIQEKDEEKLEVY